MKRTSHRAFGLVAVALFLVFLGAGSASGTTLCTVKEAPCTSPYIVGTEVKLSLATGTKLRQNMGETLVGECTGVSASGKTATAGGAGTPVEVTLSSLTFSGCTCPPTVSKPGRLIVESIPGTMNGKVRWTAFEFKESCGNPPTECVFGPEASKGMVLKGGSAATLKFERAVIPKQSGFGICGNKEWTGTFTITTPHAVYVAGDSSEMFSGAGVLCKTPTNPCLFGGPYRSSTPFREIVDPGSSTEPVVGAINSWSFGSCNCKVQVLKPGHLGIDWTSGNNGSLVFIGLQIAVDCGGKECTFGGKIKEGVTLTGGNPASIKAAAAPVPKQAGIAECSSPSKWTAEYEVSAPNPLYVSET
jgi:hypothetical protein